ncbi:MAG TPA: hypothetical protein HA348_05855 [Thermoplasmata archaeon]|nr:hypothetical protein [Thermoplasmata archaeon]
MKELKISELHNKDEKAWDTYVLKSGQSTFYHQLRSVLIQLFQSLMVEKTYKHKPIYLIAKEEEFLMRSLMFGKKLVSVPFAPYGGVCADNETVKITLIEEAKRIAEDCGLVKKGHQGKSI